MELCMKVQEEEGVILVEESTTFYTHLRFSLLASTWIPRPLGVCLWRVLHMLLVKYEALVLLVFFPIVFVLAVLGDALFVGSLIYHALFLLILFIGLFPIWGTLILLWLLISRQCCTIPPQLQGPQPAPVVEGGGGGGAAADGPYAFLKEWYRVPLTLRFVNHVTLVSFPYRREKLRDFCREIVPWYDTIVI